MSELRGTLPLFPEMTDLRDEFSRRRRRKSRPCLFDWLPGWYGATLGCVRHRHSRRTRATVHLMAGTLQHMLRLNLLVGAAKQDAEREAKQ
jgi:hypothetical protein